MCGEGAPSTGVRPRVGPPGGQPRVARQVLLPLSASLPGGVRVATTAPPWGMTTSTVTDVSPETWQVATVLTAVHRPSAVRTTEASLPSIRSWAVVPPRPATRTTTVYVGR